ncbi:hypothetical protein GQ44DRAFT_220711 [Phaeosphaeriaceae sp. PMI808]|nr:hypothetical protein GQ44DRAFT_220711 [Phaeosphaeriaceae sp. PMI808]
MHGIRSVVLRDLLTRFPRIDRASAQSGPMRRRYSTVWSCREKYEAGDVSSFGAVSDTPSSQSYSHLPSPRCRPDPHHNRKAARSPLEPENLGELVMLRQASTEFSYRPSYGKP